MISGDRNRRYWSRVLQMAREGRSQRSIAAGVSIRPGTVSKITSAAGLSFGRPPASRPLLPSARLGCGNAALSWQRQRSTLAAAHVGKQ
jgi:hypothetical protein